jgi:hypothetical protein
MLTPGLSSSALRGPAIKCAIAYLILSIPLLLIAAGIYSPGRDEQSIRLTIRVCIIAFSVFIVLYGLFGPWRRHYWNLRRARKWGLGIWRVGTFASRSSSERAMAERARSYDTETLLGIWHCPDASARAEAVIMAELKSRGLSEAQIHQWVPPPETLMIPPAASAEARARYASEPNPSSALYTIARVLALIGTVALVLLLLFAAYSILTHVPGQIVRRQAGPTQYLIQATVISWGILAFLVIPIGTLIGLSKSIRILLLRPFGQRAMTATLKKVVLRHLGPIAHVYTLSDRNYRPNPFIRIGDLVGTGVRYIVALLVRPSLRIATVKNTRTYLDFAARVGGRLKPSLRNLITCGQACNIKTTDRWWKRCIDLLMHSTDAIVMDISHVGQGSHWEIERLTLRKMLPRTVFIAQEAHEAHGIEALKQVLGPDRLPTIHLYDGGGRFREPEAFDRDLRDTITRDVLAAAAR